MASITETRASFASAAADKLARQIASRARRESPRRGWTQRAVWYSTDDSLIGVVNVAEGYATEEVFAHGLTLAADRRLQLVLPQEFAGSTMFRAPWMEHPVDVFTHDGKKADRVTLPKRKATFTAAGGHEVKPPMYFASANAFVRELEDWAASRSDLEPAHRANVRAWSHMGQRILEIKGQRSPTVKVGIDAKSQPAVTYKQGSLSREKVLEIHRLADEAIRHAQRGTYQRAEEHHLQARLRANPAALRLEHPVLREIPAWRPKGTYGERGRGFIDLAGLDGHGDIVIVETKIGADNMLVLQGLDYWIWAQRNIEWLRELLHASPHSEVRLLFAVAGAKGRAPALAQRSQRHLELLSDEISTSVLLIRQWESDPIQTEFR